jgi:hypothetical protein
MRTLEERRILDEARKIKARDKKAREAARPAQVRPTAAGQRQPRERDNVYLAWIRRLPCIRCGKTAGIEAMHIRSGYSVAGWAPTGMQEKPSDYRTAPGCRSCHRDGPDAQHRTNERKWWEALGIFPPDLCAELRAAFDADIPGDPVINRFRQRRGAQ